MTLLNSWSRIVRWGLILSLAITPTRAIAAVSYEFTIQHFKDPDASPTLYRFTLRDGKVRIAGPDNHWIYIFDGDTEYTIDNVSRAVYVNKDATLDRIAAHYDEMESQLDARAASAPDEQRTVAVRMATDWKAANKKMREGAPRNFVKTDRAEVVDGHSCTVWSAEGGNGNRLELCVAAATSISGGAEVLQGMHTLSKFNAGASLALYLTVRQLVDWWPAIRNLDGVPILVREFLHGATRFEATLTGIHESDSIAPIELVPDGYDVRDQKNKGTWNVR